MNFPESLRLRPLLGALVVAALATGCHSIHEHRRGQSSSVADYLYPDGSTLVLEPARPELPLPLRVGVAWVPQEGAGRTGLSGVEQRELADEIRRSFESLPFVAEVLPVPSSYLRAGGGWDNLGQVQRLLNLDVVVLLGYDQVHRHESTVASLAVWTIVGAYLVPSERLGTHTLLEASVFDLRSRQLLFRAPGAHLVEGRFTTLAESDGLQRTLQLEGYRAATVDLIANLHVELDRFRAEVKARPESFAVTHRPGYTGAGSAPIGIAAGLLVLGVIVGLRAGRPKSGRTA